MTLNEKLDNFYSSVIDSATAQSIAIIDEYSNTLQKVREERLQAANNRNKNTYRIEIDNIIREKNRKLSKETLDIRRGVLERTAEITEEIFQDVDKKLTEFMQTPAYEEHLVNKIKEAVEFARGDELLIYINPSDESLIPALEAKTGVKLTLSNRDFFGGIRAVIPSRTILIDNSFVTKLAEAKSTFKL
jgi:vacuolar-type H+-ATPase subunit E/Vma4